MLNFELAQESRPESLGDRELDCLYASIRHLDALYPRFGLWFWGKVVPGIGDGSRRLIPVHSGENLAALAILKRVPEERKICTLWVAPFARQGRLGRRLLSDSLAWLECDKPLITVCQERFHELQPLLRSFGFRLEQVTDSFYRPGRLEYAFNGLVGQTQAVFKRLDLSTLNLNERASGPLSLPAGGSYF